MAANIKTAAWAGSGGIRAKQHPHNDGVWFPVVVLVAVVDVTIMFIMRRNAQLVRSFLVTIPFRLPSYYIVIPINNKQKKEEKYDDETRTYMKYNHDIRS